jgi:hypothetical protein
MVSGIGSGWCRTDAIEESNHASWQNGDKTMTDDPSEMMDSDPKQVLGLIALWLLALGAMTVVG